MNNAQQYFIAALDKIPTARTVNEMNELRLKRLQAIPAAAPLVQMHDRIKKFLDMAVSLHERGKLTEKELDATCTLVLGEVLRTADDVVRNGLRS